MKIPEYINLDPNDIVAVRYRFDYGWHIQESLGWLDFAERSSKHTVLRYAALELRMGIEQLWFEILVVAVGGKLSAGDYLRATRDATKMYKLIESLVPTYEKLIAFTAIALSLEAKAPPILPWDNSMLRRFHGESSQFLHFQGQPKETFLDRNWFSASLEKLRDMAGFIWEGYVSGKSTGMFSVQAWNQKL